jgi:hypothetical protein
LNALSLPWPLASLFVRTPWRRCRNTETVPETKAENTVIRKVTLDDLEFSDIIAWLHSTRTPQELSETMVKRVVDYRDAEGDKRVVQIDALDSALQVLNEPII